MTASPADEEIDRVVDYVLRQIGQRASVAGREPTADLVRLVLQFWPHRRLSLLAKASRAHAGVAAAGVLTRARARETWEARHGIDGWNTVVASVAATTWEAFLDVWWADGGQRAAFVDYSRRLGRR